MIKIAFGAALDPAIWLSTGGVVGCRAQPKQANARQDATATVVFIERPYSFQVGRNE
jgi:hypothetical protein